MSDARTVEERLADIEEAVLFLLDGTEQAPRTPGQAAEQGHALLVARIRQARSQREGE